ncbi:hypothetical protein BANRA_05207 [Klebsiella pneumoniae]|nr:hypothetical protein BANRA_05207 [Klebsiella pneumoniae]
MVLKPLRHRLLCTVDINKKVQSLISVSIALPFSKSQSLFNIVC